MGRTRKSGRLTAVPPSSWSTMADCHFQYLPSRVTRADATSVDRISSCCRSRVGFLSVSPSMISIFLLGFSLFTVSLSLALCLYCHRFVPLYICLYRFRQQLQQLREIMEKPMRQDGDNVLPACGAEIDRRKSRSESWRAGWVAETKRRSREKDVEDERRGRDGTRE